MEAHMKIYSPYEREKKVTYANWEQVTKAYLNLIKKIDGEYLTPRRPSFTELEAECEFWQSDVSDFIKYLGIKNDEGFSKSKRSDLIQFKIRNDKRYSKSGDYDFFFGRSLDDAEKLELKTFIRDKYDILTFIKNSNTSQQVSKEKIFSYIDGEYSLNGIPIKLSKNALYYILFDSTYKITKGGGDVLYSTLKKYLVENKVKYKNNKTKKKTSLSSLNETEFKLKVKNNLLNGKGLLSLKKIKKHLNGIKGEDIFTATENSDGYLFNNKR